MIIWTKTILPNMTLTISDKDDMLEIKNGGDSILLTSCEAQYLHDGLTAVLYEQEF